MTDHDPLDMLGSIKPPSPHEAARQEALSRAMEEFNSPKISATAAQGQGLLARLISGANHWREIMSTKQFAGQALATLLIVPLAGIAAWSIIETQQWSLKAALLPTSRFRLRRPIQCCMQTGPPLRPCRSSTSSPTSRWPRSRRVPKASLLRCSAKARQCSGR